MKKIIRIRGCDDCPYRESRSQFWQGHWIACKKSDRRICDIPYPYSVAVVRDMNIKTPDWCPLEESD